MKNELSVILERALRTEMQADGKKGGRVCGCDGRAGIVWRYVTALSHDTGGGRQAGGAGTGGNRTLKVTEA